MSKATRTAALLIALVLVVAGAVGASATDERAGARRLTGCRNTTTGTLDQVTRGLLPLGGACGAGEVMVTWNRTGVQGPQGPRGYTGATGATGPAGVSGYEVVEGHHPDIDSDYKYLHIGCPAGKVVVGGGGAVTHQAAHLVASKPLLSTGWYVYAADATDDTWQLSGYAICVTALP